jgi:hypothetical protein
MSKVYVHTLYTFRKVSESIFYVLTSQNLIVIWVQLKLMRINPNPAPHPFLSVVYMVATGTRYRNRTLYI